MTIADVLCSGSENTDGGSCVARELGKLARRLCCAAESLQDTRSNALLPFPEEMADRWGVWEVQLDSSRQHLVRLNVSGQEVRGCFPSREAAVAFQLERVSALLSWPRKPLTPEPERSPTWDHPEELEGLKQYTFRLSSTDVHRKLRDGGGKSCSPISGHIALSKEDIKKFEMQGFLLGIPVLDSSEVLAARRDFDDLLAERTERAPDMDSRFRAAHTLARPLHQDLVYRMATHRRVVAIVEEILGPRFCCWSAHLFCKLPGDPTSQPWHQDAGFWPLSESRALTLWLAFDDVDESNAAVSFVEGSHRLGRLPWQPTSAARHLLTQEIPDVDLLGARVPSRLRAGEASVHCDLTVHGSPGNTSQRRRAGLALRFVATDATCLGAMINGYQMNKACILPKGSRSDPRGHWRALKKRSGNRPPRSKVQPASETLQPAEAKS